MELDAGDPHGNIVKNAPKSDAELSQLKDRDYEIYTMRIPKALNRRFDMAAASDRRDKIDILLEYIEQYCDKTIGEEIEKIQARRVEKYLDD